MVGSHKQEFDVAQRDNVVLKRQIKIYHESDCITLYAHKITKNQHEIKR